MAYGFLYSRYAERMNRDQWPPMEPLIDRLRPLRRKLTLEDFALIVGIMYTDNLVEMLLQFVCGVLREMF